MLTLTIENPEAFAETQRMLILQATGKFAESVHIHKAFSVPAPSRQCAQSLGAQPSIKLTNAMEHFLI